MESYPHNIEVEVGQIRYWVRHAVEDTSARFLVKSQRHFTYQNVRNVRMWEIVSLEGKIVVVFEETLTKSSKVL